MESSLENLNLMKLDNLIRENLIMLENSSKIKSTKLSSSNLVKMVNPYDRMNRTKPEIELLEPRQTSALKFVSPYDRSQRSVMTEEIEELAEVRPNWLTP